MHDFHLDKYIKKIYINLNYFFRLVLNNKFKILKKNTHHDGWLLFFIVIKRWTQIGRSLWRKNNYFTINRSNGNQVYTRC